MHLRIHLVHNATILIKQKRNAKFANILIYQELNTTKQVKFMKQITFCEHKNYS